MSPVNAGTPGTAAVIGLIIGLMLGWSARAVTADHRYISSLALRHEAAADYYLKQYDDVIQANKANLQKEKNTNGTKTN